MGSREVTVFLRANISDYQRKLAIAAGETRGLSGANDDLDGSLSRTETQSARTGSEIDKLSGRLRIATDAALILGPALVPLGAAAVGGLITMAAQLGATAGALGVTLLAVKGLGDGLKALDAYQLDPTAENLAKLREELDKLGPSGAHFVMYLDSIEGDLKSLQMAARDGALPGFEEGIDGMLQRLPELRAIIKGFATEVGTLAADAGDAVAGGRLDTFLEYLRTDGVPILDDTARTVGNLAEAGGNLMAVFAPTQLDFSGGILAWSRDLAEASRDLDSNAGVREFMAYIEATGPQVVDTLGSLANMVLQIVEATAPLGGPVLAGLEAVSDVIAAIADSDLGTPIFAGMAALAAYNRVLAVTIKLQKQSFAGQVRVGSTIASNVQAQVAGIKSLPGAYQEVIAAQKELAVAERTYNSARSTYVGQLQATNRLQAQGYKVSEEAQARVADSLGRVEMANYGVSTATERATAAEAGRREAMRATAREAGKAAGLIGGLALATSGVAESTGLSNTASLALMGTIGGPWGSAIGGGIGLALDLAAANDNLEAATLRANAALAGTPDEIDAARKALQDQIDLANEARSGAAGFGGSDGIGGGLSDAWNTLGNLVGGGTDKALEARDALDRVAAAQASIAETGAAAIDPLTGFRLVLENNAAAAQEEAQALEAAMNAMREHRQEALRALDAQLNYQQAIDDARKALKENGATVDKTTEKGRENLRTLYALADGWNQQSDAAKNANGSLRTARRNFIDTATDMGMAEAAAKRLADRLFEIPPKRKTQIEVETGQANAAIDAVLARMRQLKDRNVHVNVITNNVRPQGGQAPTEEQVVASGGGKAPRRLPRPSGRTGSDMDRRAAGVMSGDDTLGRVGGSGVYTRRQPAPDTATDPNSVHSMWVLADAADGAGRGLKGLKKRLEESMNALEREKNKRDAAISARDSFASTVGGAYATADPFAGGLSQFDAATQANTNDTLAAQAALAAAAGQGLDGPLYQALAASGNLALLQQFAGLSAAEIAQREQQFATQSSAQAGLGAAAAEAAGLTKAVTQLDKSVRQQQQETRHLQHVLNQLEHAVEKGAEKGTRSGNNGQSNFVASQVRTQPRPHVRGGRR